VADEADIKPNHKNSMRKIETFVELSLGNILDKVHTEFTMQIREEQSRLASELAEKVNSVKQVCSSPTQLYANITCPALGRGRSIHTDRDLARRNTRST
jgi:hypothetical protein